MQTPNMKEIGDIVVKAMLDAGYETVGGDDEPIVREAEGEVDAMFHKKDEMPVVIRCIDILTLLTSGSKSDDSESSDK